ncbi:RAB GTPase-like [Heracleum sosnowskyi]|uniref:RAB GTPase-like n=1 Tax=Heracleum sosnowskyi TaxID=360622 RepID=A0AAD8MBZ7_9APIA|nr:RAB GTPase-like [Heracleum sosnowskyi]
MSDSRSSAGKAVLIEKGKGIPLKDIPNVAFKLSKMRPDENLKLLHIILYGKKIKSLAHCDTTVARMLVGNKCDLEDIRDVSVEEGKNLAEEEGLFFIETSALDATNVNTAFENVIRAIYNNISRKVLNSYSYKSELSVNRVTLVNNGSGTKQNWSACCSR